ncbi:MAG: hypothetical protein DRP86_05205 [Candidatus Neomarinimicrobiota bacterium]|nr:MAG: hypothetical protein DRP86_05205 [Candidatus Neomarinimicrobiota bacterium]
MKKHIKAYPGIALTAVALVVVILFGIMGTFLLYISSSGGLSAAGFLNGHKAYYIADAGIEYALNQLMLNDTIINQTVNYDDGQFTITNTALSDTTYRLKSVGSVGKYIRNIQMDYYYVNVLPTYFEGATLSWDLIEYDPEGDGDPVDTSYFDGTYDPILSEDTNEPIISNYPVTLAAWILIDPDMVTGEYRVVVSLVQHGGDHTYALFTVGINNEAKLGIRVKDFDFIAEDSGYDLNDNEWHLIAAVVEGKIDNTFIISAYVDGVEYDVSKKGGNLPITGTVDEWYIGAWNETETGDEFSGYINSVGVYDQTALTQEDFQEMYTYAPDTSGAPGYIIARVNSVSEF